MSNVPNVSATQPLIDVDTAASMILQNQLASGEIPWYQSEKTDPWDHVEAAMGLAIGGYLPDAKRAFRWLVNNQLEDGSWYASYINGQPQDKTRDTNLSAYIAVGVYHYFLICEDAGFLQEMWTTVKAAIDFALSQQAPSGQIHWAISPAGKVDPMALLTGCSSIYMSLKCARAIARKLGYQMPVWQLAQARLKEALQRQPYLFNRAKSRYAMDWYYPILTGVLTGIEAQKRLDKYWTTFVVDGNGVRCVSDQPWVTLAETAELSLALSAMGNHALAAEVLHWISDKRYRDGAFWCGFTCPDMTIWPEDKLTWTNAVILMAADALHELSPASCLFHHQFWELDQSI
ncbi:MAG: phenyltransferase domain-containing protein [Desulfobacterales bacterium]|nr:phenyltransferase domain-containing protein [Desulfobacterales bacterium]